MKLTADLNNQIAISEAKISGKIDKNSMFDKKGNLRSDEEGLELAFVNSVAITPNTEFKGKLKGFKDIPVGTKVKYEMEASDRGPHAIWVKEA